MSFENAPRRIGSALLATTLMLALLAGCGGKTATPTADMYTVRGVVEKLPQSDGPDRSLYIHHEPIPGYRDENGATVGMMAMTMPFPVAPGVSLDGIAPGDPVEFTFAVTWKPKSGYEITAIHELPPDTVIDFDGGQQ